MCSSFTGEEVGKDKAFTHKSQNVKRIEGRGEGKKRKVAECAMRGCGRKRACAYTRERVGEWVRRANRTETKGGAQSEREGARRRNKGRRERKSASFRHLTTGFEMRELFVARKVSFIERKCLPLQANKHNTSLSCRNAASI